MNPRTKAVLSEVRSLLHLDRFRRFGLPLALLLVIAVLCYANLQQAQTIAAQDDLIHSLIEDSIELSAKRMQQSKARTADFKKPDIAPAQPPTDAPAPAERKRVADQ